MHEYTLAENIVDTIRVQATPRLEQVQQISLDVGRFAGVVADSLKFGLQVIFRESGNREPDVEITEVPALARCECGTEYEIQDLLENCPNCHSYNRKIRSGTDVILRSVEVDESR